MTRRRYFERMTAKRHRLDVASLSAEDALGALLASRPAAATLVAYVRAHPELWDRDPGDVAQELTTLPHVGRARAAMFVLLEVYAGRRLELE